MPGIARRVVRRYLPVRVRRAVTLLRTGQAPPPPPSPGAATGVRRPGRPGGSAPGGAAPDTTAGSLGERLRTGQSFTEALLADVRALAESGAHDVATSMATSLRRHPETADAGALATAVVATHRGHVGLAWARFAEVPAGLRWRYAADEYVRSGIVAARTALLDDVRALLEDGPDTVGPAVWTQIVGPVYGAGESDLARRVFEVLDRQVGDGSGVAEKITVNRDWLRRWIDARPDSPQAPAVPPGHVSFAIMDYGHPGRTRASANIGDHVQSLASLGHLVRRQGVRFHGAQDLEGLLQRLRDRVRPELRLTGPEADVHVITVDRDASTYAPVPPDTWMLAFGWFMHPLFGVRYGFPFHRNLNPLFVSFHCNERGLLTPQAREYLRAHGPIGCRDWTTVDILLSLDVPAFFSGCMTTTVRTVFPDLPGGLPAEGPTGYVDVPDDQVPPGGVRYAHSDDAIRFRGFATNVDDAVERLETYRRDHPLLVTSRLHCWLPARSLGVTVDFRPRNRSDIRFAGLIDTTEADFAGIRDGIDDLLEQVMGAVLAGAGRDEVYALWREITADRVEAARERRARPAAAAPVDPGLVDDVARAVSRTTRAAAGDVRPGAPEEAVQVAVQVAAHVPPGRQQALEVLLDSLTRHSSRALHVRLLTRHAGAVRVDRLAAAYPRTTFEVVATDGVGAALRRGDGSRVPGRDLDLLLLPDLLPDVDRVVLLPVDALVLDDVAHLAGLDLDGRSIAAPTVSGTRGASGFGVVHAAGTRLRTRTAAATELRRRAYARHAFDFDAFTTDVAVIDLARLRADGFVAEFLPYLLEFGLTWREVLHVAVGPGRATIPSRWAWVPTRDEVADPALVHWADPVKPWDDGYTPQRERWRAAQSAARRR